MKGSSQEYEGLFPALQWPNLQPRPSFSNASTVVPPANVSLATPQSSLLGALNKPKGKPGRPSKEEIARRQLEAAAEGRVYVSQVRKRKRENTPKNQHAFFHREAVQEQRFSNSVPHGEVPPQAPMRPMNAGYGSRSAPNPSIPALPHRLNEDFDNYGMTQPHEKLLSFEGIENDLAHVGQFLAGEPHTKNIAESPHIPTTAVTFLSEEGHNIRNCTSEDSTSDKEVFSDSNAEVIGRSGRHSDTSYDDGTTPPNPKEQSVISAVARRLVDGWVSQRQSSDVGEASNVSTRANGSRGSQTASYPSKQNFVASSHAARVSKRAGDGDDADDQPRKRRRQNAKPTPDTADPIVRLLACPYQKHDPRRYSEANLAEKEYRGCASCYILDISRLKYVDIDNGGAPSHVKRNTDLSSGNIYIGCIADQTFTANAATVSLTTATY
jgi:hypothetical protein